MNAANVSQIGAAKIILIVWYKCPYWYKYHAGPHRRPAPAPHTVFLCSKNVISWVAGMVELDTGYRALTHLSSQ